MSIDQTGESDLSETAIVLNPKGKGLRGKPHAALKGFKIVASVHLGDGQYTTGEYSHPCLTLIGIGQWDMGGGKTEPYENTILSVVFQRNRLDIGIPSEFKYPSSNALRGMRGKLWSGSYAGRVDSKLEDIERMAAGLALLERAKDAVRDNDPLRRKMYQKNCDLLNLVVGLQQIGVQVTIRDAKPFKQLRRAA